MRKRAVIVVLATCLVMRLADARGASKPYLLFPTDADQPLRSEYVHDFIYHQHALYMLSNSIWRYGPTDTEPVMLETDSWEHDAGSMRFVYGADALTVLQTDTGRLGTLQDERIDWFGSLPDWEEFLSVHEEYSLSQITLSGDLLYLRAQRSAGDAEEFELWQIDLGGGARSVVPIGGSVMSVRPHGEGMLLAVLRHVSKAEELYSVVVLDAATGSIDDTLFTSDSETVWDAVPDPVTGTIYLLVDQLVLPLMENGETGAPAAPAASISLQRLSESARMQLVADGEMAVLSSAQVGAYPLDGVQPTRTLRIKGILEEGIWARYNSAHPEAPALVDDQWITGSDTVMTEIQSGIGSDLYVVTTGYGFLPLREKGYLADLSASDLLRDEVARMYPWAQDALTQDGKLFAFPVGIYMGFWAVDQQGLDEVGLEYPASMADLFAMIEQWEGGLAEQYPEYTLLRDWIDRQQLAQTLLAAYVTQYEEPDQPLRLNTPVLRSALEWVASAPVYRQDVSDSARMLISFGQTPLDPLRYYKYYSGVPSYFPPPPFEEGQMTKVQAIMDVLIVNPQWPNADLALRFIEHLAEHAAPGTRYLLQPGLTEPVLGPDAEQRIREMELLILDQERELQNADSADSGFWSDMIAANTEYLRALEKRAWLIDADELARYREAAPSVSLNLGSSLYNLDTKNGDFDTTLWIQLSKSLEAYLAGVLPLDAMLEDMEKRVQMYHAEER